MTAPTCPRCLSFGQLVSPVLARCPLCGRTWRAADVRLVVRGASPRSEGGR